MEEHSRLLIRLYMILDNNKAFKISHLSTSITTTRQIHFCFGEQIISRYLLNSFNRGSEPTTK